jgi:hypothetical protein
VVIDGDGSSMRVEKLDDIELVGCEINEEYFDNMVVRVRNSMVQQSLF